MSLERSEREILKNSLLPQAKKLRAAHIFMPAISDARISKLTHQHIRLFIPLRPYQLRQLHTQIRKRIGLHQVIGGTELFRFDLVLLSRRG